MAKKRNQQRTYQPPTIYYIKDNTQDLWATIENGGCITDHTFYDNRDYKDISSQLEDELTFDLPKPYSNYTITSKGRVYSHNRNRFIMCYAKSSGIRVSITIDGQITLVKLEDMFELAGWEYDNNEVAKYLDEFKLLNHNCK